MFLSEASIPVIFAPILLIGSVNKPPPHPISKILTFPNGFFSFLILKVLIIFSLIYDIKPEELIKIQENKKMKIEKLDGMKFNLLKDEWKMSKDKSVNYIAKFIKL